MVFTSLHFALFFLVVATGISLLRKQEHKITWLLLAGAFFYGYWNWKFLLLIAFTSVFDFHLGIRIGAAAQPLRKRLLMLDIVVNLGILAVFKYANFFIVSADALISPAGLHVNPLNILLPLGISFFVFEAMSYCIDIYRGTLAPYTSWRQFGLFIFFFPRMIAGPIIRPADFLPQLQRPIRITLSNFCIGGQMFLMGLTKKLVIADRLSVFVDAVFAQPAHFSGWSIWQAVIAYSIQIFCDFSGYSDMALGLAKIMGFDLPVNFRMPYIAVNLTDFWRRWHISLSSWLRDYLYIPLGGNRRGVSRTYLNLLITMALGGLWHGASWNFVIWGVLHGLGLAVHKAYSTIRKDWRWQGNDWLTRIISWALTFTFVCVCWLFFRAHSMNDAMLCLRRMLGLDVGGVSWLFSPIAILGPAVVLAHGAGVWLQHTGRRPVLNPARFSHLVFLWFWILGIFLLSATVSAPFIYFQF